MTQEERNILKAQVIREIADLEKSIRTLSGLLDGEVQSDANDWFTSNHTLPFLRLTVLPIWFVWVIHSEKTILNGRYV